MTTTVRCVVVCGTAGRMLQINSCGVSISAHSALATTRLSLAFRSRFTLTETLRISCKGYPPCSRVDGSPSVLLSPNDRHSPREVVRGRVYCRPPDDPQSAWVQGSGGLPSFGCQAGSGLAAATVAPGDGISSVTGPVTRTQ